MRRRPIDHDLSDPEAFMRAEIARKDFRPDSDAWKKAKVRTDSSTMTAVEAWCTYLRPAKAWIPLEVASGRCLIHIEDGWLLVAMNEVMVDVVEVDDEGDTEAGE